MKSLQPLRVSVPALLCAPRVEAGEADGRAQSGTLDIVPHGLREGACVAALCQDRSATRNFILTCGHAFLDAGSELWAHIDLLDGNGRIIARGRVDQCEPAAPGQAVAHDAALVEIAPETARTLALAYPYLRPAAVGSSALAERNSLILQTGRGALRGVLVGPVADLNVRTTSGSLYTLRSVYTYRAAEPTQPGDSGCPVWDENGRLVGIHCGGLDGDPGRICNAFFCPIDPIAEAFGVRVLTSESADLPPLPPGPAVSLPPPADAGRELDVVARTIWGEAGELGEEAMNAVAAVILNRRSYGKWMGGTALEVCLRPYQFRCWDVSSPAIHRMRVPPPDDSSLQMAREIAGKALASGIVPDPTQGATRYHPEWVVPAWAERRQILARIAGLWFYRVD